jgi:hypothetical protein
MSVVWDGMFSGMNKLRNLCSEAALIHVQIHTIDEIVARITMVSRIIGRSRFGALNRSETVVSGIIFESTMPPSDIQSGDICQKNRKDSRPVRVGHCSIAYKGI